MNVKDVLVLAAAATFILSYFIARTDLNKMPVKLKVRRNKGK